LYNNIQKKEAIQVVVVSVIIIIVEKENNNDDNDISVDDNECQTQQQQKEKEILTYSYINILYTNPFLFGRNSMLFYKMNCTFNWISEDMYVQYEDKEKWTIYTSV
jgi:hypothetical protein